jgi:hypothetical protein
MVFVGQDDFEDIECPVTCDRTIAVAELLVVGW